ncbi:tapasin-related protein-like isoform X2 [Polypterus senegalus]|uniref:tapasin-related protein-like isoform X2 n=1 Tax=Polypterus senegalus TaxID=55291 RepID=UPI0019665958|nr:tapasin-related protein-like isoform X2 [Polypterus senegalus]
MKKVVSAKFNVSTSQPVVNAPLYSDVLLPCNFELDSPNKGLKFVILKWEHNGKELTCYIHGEVKSNGKGTLLKDELPKGNSSLLLKNVTIEDEGEYVCDVYEVPHSGKVSVRLNVTATPRVTVTPSMIVMNQLNSLECLAEGFYPGDINIKLLRDSEPLPSEGSPQPQKNPDGTYNAVTRYNYTPTSEDADRTFYCEVTHKALDTPLVKKLPPVCDPVLVISPKTLLVGKEQTVTCKLDGCLFTQTAISLKINQETLKMLQCENSKECVIRAMVMVEEEKEVVCEAKMDGFNFTLSDKFEHFSTSSSMIVLITFVYVVIGIVVVIICKLGQPDNDNERHLYERMVLRLCGIE